MLGKNPVRKKYLHPLGHLRVQEVFKTIQGEGPLAGMPAVFIRLAGCNLRCHFCDTDFETNWNNELSPVGLLHLVDEAAKGSDISLLVITGGEPMLQNLEPFLSLVTDLDSNWNVQIETAGTVWSETLDDLLYLDGVKFVVSPKTGTVVQEIRTKAQGWKYIVRAGELDPDDGLPNASTQLGEKATRLARPRDHHLRWQRDHIYLQPCDEGDPAKNQANLEAAIDSCMKHGYRLCLQQHKMVGLP